MVEMERQFLPDQSGRHTVNDCPDVDTAETTDSHTQFFIVRITVARKRLEVLFFGFKLHRATGIEFSDHLFNPLLIGSDGFKIAATPQI
jgi:hypothetical protein